jgi:hypothetical protein
MERVPTDVLLFILSFLNRNSLLYFGVTSRTNHLLSRQAKFLKEFRLRALKLVNDDTLEKITTNFPSLEVLDCRTVEPFQLSLNLATFSKNLGNITTLILDFLHFVKEEDILTLLETYRTLQFFSIRYCKFISLLSPTQEFSKPPTKLRHFGCTENLRLLGMVVVLSCKIQSLDVQRDNSLFDQLPESLISLKMRIHPGINIQRATKLTQMCPNISRVSFIIGE